MKGILTRLIILALIVIGFIAAYFMGFSIFDALFSNDGPKIEKTANVVAEVKNISKITTACFYEEIPMSKTKVSSIVDNNVVGTVTGWFGKKPDDVMQDDICVIVSGKVRAGYDLSQLTEEGIIQSNDTIWVTLPEVQIFDAVVNPSDIDIFVEDGSWSYEEMTQLTMGANKQLLEDATAAGILDLAKTSGEEQLQNLFKSFGFNTVILK